MIKPHEKLLTNFRTVFDSLQPAIVLFRDISISNTCRGFYIHDFDFERRISSGLGCFFAIQFLHFLKKDPSQHFRKVTFVSELQQTSKMYMYSRGTKRECRSLYCNVRLSSTFVTCLKSSKKSKGTTTFSFNPQMVSVSIQRLVAKIAKDENHNYHVGEAEKQTDREKEKLQICAK